jgi:hypothetical protein
MRGPIAPALRYLATLSTGGMGPRMREDDVFGLSDKKKPGALSSAGLTATTKRLSRRLQVPAPR